MIIKDLLLGQIDGIIIEDGITYLCINRSNHTYEIEYDDILIPLLCPICGKGWHFNWQGNEPDIEIKLADALQGYEIALVHYVHRSTTEHVNNAMEKLYSTSDLPQYL